MVENHPDAWPLSGMSKAQVVIEAPVEGGITRFLVFFDPATEVDEIGPVRSARPYYVEWADSWHAFYAHVGGSSEGLRLIQTKDNLIDIDQFRHGNTFWRSILRFAPHNVYTSMRQLTDFATTNEHIDETMPMGWHFFPRKEGEEIGDIETVEIPYGGIYDVTWEYDGQEDHFVRYQNGRMQFGHYHLGEAGTARGVSPFACVVQAICQCQSLFDAMVLASHASATRTIVARATAPCGAAMERS